MATYLDIIATQRPFPIGNDQNGQPMLSFNVRANGADVNGSWETDLAFIIHNAGLGTLYTDLFIGSSSDIPTGATVVEINDTGGVETVFASDNFQLPKLSAQILVRAPGHSDARTRANAIYELLNGKRNITV